MKKIISNFIADIIIAVVFLAIGVIMFPLLPMGEVILSTTLAVFLIVYVAAFLLKSAFRSSGICFIFGFGEIAIVILLAIGIFLKQFSLLGGISFCSLLGIVVWTRGCTLIVRDKYARPSKSPKLPFLIALFLVTAGAVLSVYPIISNGFILWLVSIFSFVVALIFGFLAILVAPYGGKKK